MLNPSPNPKQMNLLYPNLMDQLNPQHPLLKLGSAIPWEYFEEEFSLLYSHRGKPAIPIRLMAGLSILKHLYNLSDVELIHQWVQSPYYQVFCGEVQFQWKFPCDSSDMTYFRKRIGKEGFEKVLAVSIQLHGEEAKEKDIHVDTTVQEKNVTFPSDDELYLKIINKMIQLANENAISLRRTYQKEIKERKLALRFRHQPQNQKKVRKAIKRLKTIAGVLLREVQRKLPDERLQEEQEALTLYSRVLNQKRHDKNKIYSLHESHIYCIAKGKINKRYEFGTKASIAKTCISNIIVGALAFEKNDYDGHTLPEVLAQVKKLSALMAENARVDRGYRGKRRVNHTQIFYPTPVNKEAPSKLTAYLQKQFRKRAGIEVIIGHLKSDHRLDRNFLKAFLGDEINVLMAAAAFNFRKWMRKILFWVYFWLEIFSDMYGEDALTT